MTLVLPRPKSKPRTPVLDRSHRLARGLVTAFLMTEGGGTEIRDHSVPFSVDDSTATTMDWKAGATIHDGAETGRLLSSALPVGIAERHNRTTSSGKHTVCIRVRVNDTAQTDKYVFGSGRNGGITTHRHQLSILFGYVARTFESFSGGGGAIRQTIGTIDSGDTEWHTVAYSFDEVTNKFCGWIDGVQTADTTDTSSITAYAGAAFHWSIGGAFTGAYFDGDLGFIQAWDRVLSPAEITELHSDPWGMWQRPSRWVYSAQEEGGGGYTPPQGLNGNLSGYTHTIEDGFTI